MKEPHSVFGIFPVSDSLLTPEQKIEFKRRWAVHGLTLEKGLLLRRRARTDLFFLAKELLGYAKLKEKCHREVCDWFTQKDPDAPTFESFARAYRGRHDRALSLMRGGFKSTLDICDKVQWTICYPEVRINLMTAVLSLSQEFVGIFKGHFTTSQDGTPKIMQNGQPSLFQILFPEFCDSRSADFTHSDSPEWTTPARFQRFSSITAPTIRAASAKAGKTGTHCDLAVFDDVCTEDSVGSEGSVATNLRKIARRISMARNLRVKYGFTDLIFTPYAAGDYNCEIVEMEKKRALMGLPPLVDVLVRPAARLTETAIAAGKTWENLLELEEFDVEMWDEEEYSLENMKLDWTLPNGRDMVASQKLLDVSLKTATKFTRAQLLRATKPWNLIPQGGLKVMAGDLAYSDKPRADLSVLGTANIEFGRIYLTAIKRDRVNEDRMPEWIAEEIFRQRPDRVAIENSVGVKWLKRDIRLELVRMGWVGPDIEWVDIGQGQWKRTEVNAEYPSRLVQKQQLVFSTGVEKLEVAYEELEVFPSPKHHDDIVAMLNLLCHHFVTESDLIVGEAEHSERNQLWEQRAMGYGSVSRQEQAEMDSLTSLDLPGDIDG